MNIVITGPSGFIGNKLLSKMKYLNLNLNIKIVDRTTLFERFDEIFRDCDYCFHLAGEVRPNATYDDFYTSNVVLTKNIINSIKLNQGKTKILFASTIHTRNPKNDYGFSKLHAEEIISSYNNEFDLIDLIYRLPHLYGTGAKPDHNSVFTTWVYNAVNGKKLEVYDSNVEMTYIQVDELIEVMVAQMFTDEKLSLPKPYVIKLGELKDTIISLNNGTVPENKLQSYIVDMLQEAKAS